MFMSKNILLILSIWTLGIATSQAQDTTKATQTVAKRMVYIETYDGNTFTGSVVLENDTEIKLKTTVGEITIPKNNIKKMRELSNEDFKNGAYWFENPNSTRYIVGPSAFGLKKGEGYYQNMYLFIQSVNVGITKNISIGGGTEIASIIFGGEAPLATFLTPKASFEINPKLHLGTGVLYLNTRMGGSGNNSHYGIGYGLATVGSRNTNFTFGLGWGYHSIMKYESLYNQTTQTWTNNRYRDKGFNANPIITLSGMARTGKRFSLVTENWIFPRTKTTNNYNAGTSTTTTSYDFIISYGARFMGEKMAVDFGFLNSPEWSDFIKIGIPYIDFVVKFGGDKMKKSKKK
jgi:hypothetical protein